MERVNVYRRKDGRWEGRISRGKRKAVSCTPRLGNVLLKAIAKKCKMC